MAWTSLSGDFFFNADPVAFIFCIHLKIVLPSGIDPCGGTFAEAKLLLALGDGFTGSIKQKHGAHCSRTDILVAGLYRDKIKSSVH